MKSVIDHPVRLLAPHYGDRGAMLHRYLDTAFVPRFKRELQRGGLSAAAAGAWREEERLRHRDQHIVLRLPLHRVFYLVSCRVACQRLGWPALGPERVASAGFVIRRVGGGVEEAWMLEDGEALGWEPAPGERRDPDLARRLRADDTLARRGDPAAYSGEDTHPLHVATARDINGKRHTVLFGYVPLGGFHYRQLPVGDSPFDPASEAAIREAVGGLPWPFGFGDGRSSWRDVDERQVQGGDPSAAFVRLLATVVERHHLGEEGDADQSPLATVTRRIWFYDDGTWPLSRGEFSDRTRDAVVGKRRSSLYEYLADAFAEGAHNPLAPYLARQDLRLDAGQEPEPIPGQPGEDSLSLYLSEADAQELRSALEQRALVQAATRAEEIPIPKFGQAEGDLYRIVPFVRYLDGHGCERITWADDDACSEVFGVAAPFDPEASRPSLIQMPALSDLRRGLARGASVLTPGDTFSLLNSLKLKKGASPEVVPEATPRPGGVQWICSFSLPVVTLVAMILLMIMVALLNIVFWWLPWVRICLPFPSLKR